MDMKRHTISVLTALTVTAMPASGWAQSLDVQIARAADLDQSRADRERAREDQERAREDQERARDDQRRAREDQERARGDRVEQAYERGRNFIERGEWTRAVEQFSTLVSDRAPRADAALYWRAYALDKLNRQTEALTSVAELSKTFPTSRWLNDARALELQIRQRAGQPVSPDQQGDEELKLLAIQGLMQSDPAQSVPMLEKLLQGSSSPRLKERALFVLAQSNSSRAQEVLGRVARGNANPDLQEKAIQFLGMNSNEANRQLLSEIYQASNDIAVKRRVLRAFMMAGDRTRVLNAATTEKSTELRGEAVRLLGMMGARDQLWQLYQKESAVDVKQQILQGMGMAGDSSHLADVANSETNPELLRTAIRQIGISGGGQGKADALLAIYSRQKDASVKGAVLDALFIGGNADTLVALARKETDSSMKRRIVEKLSLMNAPSARNYMLELLEK
jgi:HEAT repeat protein